MKKLDRIIMIIELIAGFAMLALGVIQNSWIAGWCSVVCIMSGFFIGTNAELGEIWGMMRKQNEVHMELLEGITEICKEAVKNQESQGGSNGSSSGS